MISLSQGLTTLLNISSYFFIVPWRYTNTLLFILLGQIIQLTALEWMKTFLEMAGPPMLPFTANILSAILPCLSYEADKRAVKNVAMEVNQLLKLLITPDNDIAPDSEISLKSTLPKKERAEDNNAQEKKDGEDTIVDTSPLNLVSVLEVLMKHMEHKSQAVRTEALQAQGTRMEALHWLLWLHQQLPRRTYLLVNQLFPSLMNLLSDNSDKVCTANFCLFVCLLACFLRDTVFVDANYPPPPPISTLTLGCNRIIGRTPKDLTSQDLKVSP